MKARLALLLSITLLAACSPEKTETSVSPLTEHVIVILEENKNYEDVIGSVEMSFFNELAETYALAENIYAPVHSSPATGLFLLTGKIVTKDRSYSGTVSIDNLARELTKAERTWKVYAEDLPSPGYVGEDAFPYLKRHNPFAYVSDVRDSKKGSLHVVPFAEFREDLKNATLPNFSFIVPNTVNDGHECQKGTKTCTREMRLRAIDAWLQFEVPALLKHPSFQKSGLLLIVFDESENDVRNGGGRVPVVFAGSGIRRGYSSDAQYGFEDLLRLIAERLKLERFPGAAASGRSMEEFFLEGRLKAGS